MKIIFKKESEQHQELFTTRLHLYGIDYKEYENVVMFNGKLIAIENDYAFIKSNVVYTLALPMETIISIEEVEYESKN